MHYTLKKNPKQDIWFSRKSCSFFLTYQVIRFVTELLATSLSGYKCAFFLFSENYVELENCGPTDVKWHLSSFAPPYVKVSHLPRIQVQVKMLVVCAPVDSLVFFCELELCTPILFHQVILRVKMENFFKV